MDGIGFAEFLTWLVYGGGATMASSWLLERWAWFQGKTAKAKEVISFAVASVMAVGAMALATYGGDFVAQAEPFFMVLSAVFSMVFLKNMFHRNDKPKGKG